MKCAAESKPECADKHKNGVFIDNPSGPCRKAFMSRAREWAKRGDGLGIGGPKPSPSNKARAPERRFGLAAEVLAGGSIASVRWPPVLDGLAFRSGQGRQCRTKPHSASQKGKGARRSMPRKGDRCGSRIAGSLSGKMKSGMLYGHERESGTFDAFKREAAGCVDYYKNERIRGKTKWMPPGKFREASMSSLRYDSVNLSRKLGTYQTSPLLNEAD